MDQVLSHLKQHRDTHLQWTRDLCAIPSISTKDEHRGDVAKSVKFTHELCEKIGLKSKIMETGGHPLVYAEWTGAPNAPTYLAYGHVDVQPTGDLSLWDADPFEPVVKGDWLICRGSADDKGQVLLYLRAAEAWLKTHGKLPVNVKFLIEAEEEIGSPNLAPFVAKHRDMLAAEAVLISDTGMYKDGFPTLTIGTRGLVYKEILVSGPTVDLHSGTHGGVIPNPTNVVARLVASLHDADGRVTVKDFYKNVQDASAEERERLAALPFNEREYLDSLGPNTMPAGEVGWTTQERRSCRPTLDCNGIFGGFMQPGANTIIPAKAGAKISMRLVPNQNAEKIAAAFDETIRERCPKGVTLEIKSHGSADAYVTPIDSPVLKAAERALRDAYGQEPALIREGGSLPILPMFQHELGAPSILLGFASPHCNAHGPNEKAFIPDLDRGAETIARLFQQLAK